MDLRSALRPVLRPVARVVRPMIAGLQHIVSATPQVGRVNFGDLRRTRPFCAEYGYSRGLPIDRVYIEQFLETHRADVRGSVLEIADRQYTTRFGGAQVTHSDVLDIDGNNPIATIIADLTSAEHIEGKRYDTIIVTQTLQLIFDVPAALATLHRLLKPGGVLLVTVCGISSTGNADAESASWCWSFTQHSLRRSLLTQFEAGNVQTASHGNVLTAVSFLEGLAAGELEPHEFAVQDAAYPVVVSARAVKRNH